LSLRDFFKPCEVMLSVRCLLVAVVVLFSGITADQVAPDGYVAKEGDDTDTDVSIPHLAGAEAQAPDLKSDKLKNSYSEAKQKASPFKKMEQHTWKPSAFTYAKAHVLGVEVDELKPSEFEGSVLDWHYTMVNDETRNSKYRHAMERVINNNSIVLDIGTGAGLLALISARAGAKEVYTVEFEEPMWNIAQKVIAANGYTDKIQSFNDYSSNLVVPDNMTSKANVLVSEIVDSIIIGEGMIPSYRHALDNLVTEDVKMIPFAGELYFSAVECDEIRQDLVLLEPVEKLNFSPLNEWVADMTAPRGRAFSLDKKQYQLLNEPTIGITYDFTNRSMYDQEWPLYRRIDLIMTADGIFDAVAVWFDLHLDENTVISTSPLSGWAHERHWTQYVYKVRPFRVNIGDIVTLLLGIHETSLQADVLLVNGQVPQTLDEACTEGQDGTCQA